MNIPSTMQAVHLEKPGGPLVVRTIPVPSPGKGEVLVKIAASPVNPSDLARIKSLYSGENLLTFIPGIEGSGKVVAAGKGLLPALWLGKRVACSSLSPSSGTWAEYMVTSASLCFPLPDKITDEQGSMLLVNPMTAVAFFDIIRKEKHKAIVNSAAAGALGNMIRLLGKKYNIPVINVVRNDQQVRMLKSDGALHVLNSSDKDFTEQLCRVASELNATLGLDPISGSYTRQLLEALPYGGTVIVYGNLSASDIGPDLRPLISDNKKVHGFYLANWMKENSMLKIMLNLNRVRQLLKNDFNIKVQNRYPFVKVQLAIDTYLNNMTGGKVLIVPQDPLKVS